MKQRNPKFPMISYAQHFEDVLINRFFGGKKAGFYIDVGAQHPKYDSVTKYFYDIGWSGINVEPQENFFSLITADRPRDINLNLALSDQSGDGPFFEFPASSGYSGLSTLESVDAEAASQAHGVEPKVHRIRLRTLADICAEYKVGSYDFLKIDVEGHEKQVIAGANFEKHRPRLIIVEATRPELWESLLFEANYKFAAFDGLNRFYVAQESEDRLEILQIPANPKDNFIQNRILELEQAVDRLNEVQDYALELEKEYYKLRDNLESARRLLCVVGPKYSLSVDQDSGSEQLVTSDKRVLSIVPGLIFIALDKVEIIDNYRQFAGWAADMEHLEPAEEIVLFVKGEFLHAGRPHLERPDVVAAYDLEGLRWSGFRFEVPIALLGGHVAADIRIFAVSARGAASELYLADSSDRVDNGSNGQSMNGEQKWSEAAELYNDQIFQDKYQKIPGIISDWVSEYLDFSTSTVMDFGCGLGLTALGVAQGLRPHKVVGVDLGYEYRECLPLAQKKLGLERLPDNLAFQTIKPNVIGGEDQAFDFIFSWSVFEHVDRDLLDQVTLNLKAILKPGGLFFVQVTPLYYSAFGSHFWGLVDTPWAHLLWQYDKLQRTVLDYPNDCSDTGSDENPERVKREGIWNCFESLNHATAEGLKALFDRHGFVLEREHRTSNSETPPAVLTHIYNEDVLTTEQIVLLLRKGE